DDDVVPMIAVDVDHVEEPVPQASQSLPRIADDLRDVRKANRFADVEPEDLVVERIALAGNLDAVRSIPKDPRMVPAIGAVDHVIVDSHPLQRPPPGHGTDPAEASYLQHPDPCTSLHFLLDERLDHREGDRTSRNR